MNITYTMTQKRVGARFLAALTTISMILSAFPVAFFVANAAVNISIMNDSFETEPAFSSPAWTNDPKWSTNATNAHTGSRKAKVEGNTNGAASLEISVSTVGFESISLSFWYKISGFEANDNDRIEVDWYDGTDWNALVTLDGADVTEWTEWTGLLGTEADDNADTRLRFTAYLDAGNDKFFLDDVNLKGIELVDMCENIDGYQQVVPDGYELTNNGCYPEIKPVSPVFECWVDNEDDTITGYFGYSNPNDSMLTIAIGDNNKVNGPLAPDAGQPTEFAAGRTGYVDDGGVFKPENAAFSVTYPTSGNITWTLNGKTATAGTPAGKECPAPIEPVAPTVCSYEGIAVAIQGNKNDTTPVDANRSLTSAIENGVASYSNFFGKEGNDWQVNPLDFYSLGINGEVVYEFTDKIALDQAGADIAIWEITGGNASEQSDESVDVYLSANGIDFELAGTVIGDGTVDIADTSLDFVKFVKLVDQSAGTQGPGGDGYDLDAITIIDGSCDDFATIHTAKIVCDLERELPDLGGNSGPEITSDFAANWLADNQDTSCRLVDGWEFEWAPKTASNPGNTHVGTGGANWNTFVDTGVVPASVFESDNSFWMREVLPSDYIPFTGGKNNNVSAELYCHVDGLNYDNFDRIDKPKAGEEYYCVAWNVPVEKTSEVTLCKYNQDDEPLANWQLALLGERIDNITVIPDGSTQSLIGVPAGEYVLKAEGTYEYRGNTGLLADARFSERQAGDVDFGTYPYNPWREALAGSGGLAVQVNGDLGALWGSTFSPGHVYYGSLTQAVTSDVDLYVYDNVYTDNVGEIDVSLYTGRTALTGNDGCVTFNDVPYGTYQIEELLQVDWTNVSGLGEVQVNDETEVFNVVNTDFVQAPYCGDGERNQEWEQCDKNDVTNGESCTDYCTLANQCSAEQLIKITLDPSESTSFDGSIHLGAEGNTIPNGTWFNFNEVGDDSFVSIANATEGLAVERNQVDNTLTLAFVGGNGTKKLDIARGTIMTKGITLGSVNREPNPQFKLEDGSGASFDDVFDKNLDESIDFDLRADTGNDGVSVMIGMGDEYDCPECKATVEARVVLNENGQTGNGDLNERVILGDSGYTTVEFGEWFPISVVENGDTSATMISDPNTVTNFANPSDKPGLFVSREGGTVKVALYGKHNPGGNTNNEWIDARIEVRDAQITNFSTLSGNFKFENHSDTDNVPTNDGSDTAVADSAGVDFRMWVDTQSDGFKFNIDQDSIVSCDDDSKDMIVIDGYKYEDLGGGSIPVGDWTIELYEEGESAPADAPVATTTTNDLGYYSFNVPEGDYDVYEVLQTGWKQSYIVLDGRGVENRGDDVLFCRLDTEQKDLIETARLSQSNDSESDYRCDFYNQRIQESQALIYGYKFETLGSNEVPDRVSNWVINLEDGEGNVINTTTTNLEGYYEFVVTPGEYYEIHEVMQSGWQQVSVFQGEEEILPTDNLAYCGFDTSTSENSRSEESSYRCEFYNERVDDEESEINDRRSSRTTSTRIERALPTPLVAGATTVNTCPFLTEFMQIGVDNNTMEVMKLQLFLNIFKDMFGGSDNPVTGTFDAITDANVKAFQETFRSEVLNPWYERGIVPHNRPTGFVYKTTLWKINSIVCPDSAVEPDFAGEDLTRNVNID